MIFSPQKTDEHFSRYLPKKTQILPFWGKKTDQVWDPKKHLHN